MLLTVESCAWLAWLLSPLCRPRCWYPASLRVFTRLYGLLYRCRCNVVEIVQLSRLPLLSLAAQ